jgi:phosphoesterase RecJ-like protein
LQYAGVEDIIAQNERIFSIINIDHHATNQHYGEINLVDPEASSTAEIIFNFLNINNQPVDKHMATALLAGILTDTSNFTNPGTTIGSMKVASRLISYGARTNEISRHLLKNKSIDALRLWGKTLTRLEENKKFNMAIAVIRQEDLADIDAKDEAVEGVSNFLNAMLAVEIVLVLRETDEGFVKGSLRSTSVDVARLAKALGGGGHKKAAGFSIKGRLEQIDGKWKVV